MILSALVQRRKKDSKTTQERLRDEHFDFKGFWFVYLLVWIFKSVPWWVSTQTSKVAWVGRKPCVQKDIKGFRFWAQVQPLTAECIHVGAFLWGLARVGWGWWAPVLSFQRWAPAQHFCFDAFLCYLCAKRRKKQKHKSFSSWNAVSLAANQ